MSLWIRMRKNYFTRVGNIIAKWCFSRFLHDLQIFIIKNIFFQIFNRIALQKKRVFLVSHLHCVITTFTIYIFLSHARLYSARWIRKIIYDASGGNVSVYMWKILECAASVYFSCGIFLQKFSSPFIKIILTSFSVKTTTTTTSSEWLGNTSAMCCWFFFLSHSPSWHVHKNKMMIC